MTWIWWMPAAATSLHIFEEFAYPGGFADWDRTYRPAIRASITRRFHVVINGALLLLCVQVGLLAPLEHTGDGAVAAGAWLAVAALLFSNAVFHVIGTIRTRTRSPGVISGVLLYVPMALLGYWWFLTRGEFPLAGALVAALVGGSYHFWAGWMHSARGGRAARKSG